MKHLCLVVCAAVLAVLFGAVGSARASAPTAKRVCTTGQVRCLAMVETTSSGRLLAAATPGGLPFGISPEQLHKVYNLPFTSPSAPTVAIVAAFDYPSAYADLKTASNGYALPILPRCATATSKSCFRRVNLGAPANSAPAHDWDVETMLDIETVHAICENCGIVLVEAKSASLSNFVAAERNAAGRANIVSNSWGASPIDGSIGAKSDAAFNQPNHALIFASGDDGYSPSYPSLLNTVISVGGTTLRIGAGNAYLGETAWSGTGSGCASGTVKGTQPVMAQPFQRNATGFATAGCPAGIRGDNDVAAVADPATGVGVYVSHRGWIQVGGTSLAAPLIAGVYGLAGNAGASTWPAAGLYGKLGTSAFHDVTSGSNIPKKGCDGVIARCSAGPGYDLPTGVGTPNGLGGF